MNRRQVLILLMLICVSPCLYAQSAMETHEYFSPYNAKTLHKIAYEIYNYSAPDSSEDRQAMLLLTSIPEIDYRSKYVYVDILELGSAFKSEDYSRTLMIAMMKYIDENADLHVVTKAIRYILDRLDSRQQREVVLATLFSSYKDSNKFLTSELLTEIAILASEKSAMKIALNQFMIAYQNNPYNRIAFSRLHQLSQINGNPLGNGFLAKHYRLMLIANPMDIDAAMDYAAFCQEVGLYSIASSVYEYSAELFEYLYPGANLPASIYLPWALSNYNTARSKADCIRIARIIRQSGRLDLMLEAIAADAARKMGDKKSSDELLNAGIKAERLLTADPSNQQVTPEQIAWFYAFASPNVIKALAWSKRGILEHPDSVQAKAIYAYTLVMNGQEQIAADIIRDIYQQDQVASIAMAMVELVRQNNEVAIDILKDAVKMEPGSLAAQTAKILLEESGSDYIPETNSEIILQILRNDFEENVVPRFKKPSELVAAKINISGTEFAYGKDFDASLVINNNATTQMIIDDNAMIKGSIRVDAKVTGDIEIEFPELISKKFRPGSPVESGDYISIPIDLITGSLRKLMFTYPQASLDIQFTVYLDPVTDANGNVTNRLNGFEPIVVNVKRVAERLTRKFLLQRIDALSKGQMKQKIKTANLFAGLLMEQYAMEKTKVAYKYMAVEKPLLIDGLRMSLADEDWTVRFQTMAMILQFPKPLDYELLEAVSKNLNDKVWPLRMMSVYVLSKYQGQSFKNVLDWIIRYDSSLYVQEMAAILGGERPPVEE